MVNPYRSPETQRMWRLAARYSTIGMEMAASVAFGTLGGWWLDQKLGTEPWIFWFGLAFGIAAAVRAVVRLAKNTKLDSL